MPFQMINGASIYYEVLGHRRGEAMPILLIHGSMATVESDWGNVIPALAEQYLVIAPDCRGHGKSSNPNRSYSFGEMARDLATLVRALGFDQAHVIGHSNGGNVALIYLMEHPEAARTVVIQAGNARVTPDLIERENRMFTPEYVEANRPEWMQQMIELHDSVHGAGYWRELMRWTLKEILAGPNYTPQDLAQVRKPVLVVEGMEDPVNAPGHQAEYMAANIPGAELWRPEGVKHNVHKERQEEWLARVLDFFQRRG
ncbi:MAG TPA: alpha/beta hydrolase [Anaerolineae bacterium]